MPGPPTKRYKSSSSSGATAAAAAAEAAARARAASATADALGAPASQLALGALLAAPRAAPAAPAVLRALRDALGEVPRKKVASGDGSVRKEMARLGKVRRFVNEVAFGMAVADVEVVGGFMLVGGETIDVAVGIGEGVLQGKDFRNYKYADKRLLFLVALARFLRKRRVPGLGKPRFGPDLAADESKPTVILDGDGFQVRLLPAIAAGVFDVEKLAADRGNVRDAGVSSLEARASPRYNASVVVDMLLVRHLATLHARAASAPSFRDAVEMVRAWTARRRLPGGGFVAAALVAHVIAAGGAPARAAKEHLFRAVVGRVRDGVLGGLVVDGVKVADAAGWDSGVLGRWRKEAGAVLTVLDWEGGADDAWAGAAPFLFVAARGGKRRPVPLATVFDAFVTVRGGEVGNEEVTGVLAKALVDTKRVETIEAIGRGVFGLALRVPDPAQDTYRKVDVRPDDVDRDVFREFWGPRAEVRRFKDGRIVDSLVWSGGLGVIGEIVEYVAQRHFGDGVEATVALAQVEEAAGLLGVDHGAASAIAVFNELSSALRRVKGIPLAIATVQAVSPHLRRCAVQSVQPKAKSKFMDSMDILAVFEQSAAWPDDPLAMASAKAGFYLALKAGLAELGIASRPTVSFTDILMGGFVFRLRVRVDKEKTLVGMEKSSRERLVWETEYRVRLHDAMRNVPSTVFGDTVRLLKRWLSSHMLLCVFGDRAEELVELIVARVFSVHHGRAPRSVLSGFCHCLHLLAEFPWEAAPLVVPLSTVSAEEAAEMEEENGGKRNGNDDESLYRTALDSCNAVIAANETRSVHVCTSFDPEGSWFGSKNMVPERVVLKRASAAAAAALAMIESSVTCTKSPDAVAVASPWEALFRTPASAFHHTIVLDRAWVVRGPKSVPKGSEFYSAHPVVRLDTTIVGLDPVENLFRSLKATLGQFAMFLFDRYDSSKIYIVWRPAAGVTIPFSLQSLAFMTPVPGAKQLAPNKEEMLRCVERLGGELIKKVI